MYARCGARPRAEDQHDGQPDHAALRDHLGHRRGGADVRRLARRDPGLQGDHRTGSSTRSSTRSSTPSSLTGPIGGPRNLDFLPGPRRSAMIWAWSPAVPQRAGLGRGLVLRTWRPGARNGCQPGDLPALDPAVPHRRADPRRRARLRGRPTAAQRDRRGLQADVRARQGRAARPRHPAGDRPQQPLRRRGRLPHPARATTSCPPIEFDAAEAAAVGLAARLWQSATLGEPARAGADQAARGRHRGARRRRARARCRSSTPATPACRRCSTPRAPRRVGRLRLLEVRRASRRAPHARAVGRAVVAAAVVRRRSRPRPRRAAQLPALAHHRAGRAGRRARARSSGPRTSTCSSMVAGRGPDDRPRGPRAGVRRRRPAGCAASPTARTRRRADHRLHRHRSWLARLDRQRRAGARVLDPPDLVAAVVRRGCAPVGAGERRWPRRPRTRSGCRGCSRWCPYLQARPGIAVAEAAADFGVTEAPAAPRPHAAVDVRAARPRPG